MFKVNEGTIDRVLRVALGIALVALALTKGWMWAWIGVVPLQTGATGLCPRYSIVGVNNSGV